MSAHVALDLTGRRVVVFGGGPAASERVAALLADDARPHVVAPALCEDLADLADGARIDWRRGDARPDDLEGAWLAVPATGSATTDADIAAWCLEQRVWCEGSAVRPLAASVHGGVSVGVDGPSGAHLLAQIDDFLTSGGADLRAPGGGRVTLVGGGPGDPGLVTVAGMHALRTADVVVTDRLAPVELLRMLPPDVEVIDVGKAPTHHPVPQHEINALLVEHAGRGRHVVRFKGGDPFVLGRGGEEVGACREAGVPVSVIPGVSSAVAAPSAAGIPVTHRGVATGYLVVTGHGGLSSAAVAALQDGSATVVVLMGVSMLADLVGTALAAGVDADVPVAVIERATTPHQRVVRTTLGRAAGVDVAAPAVILLGGTAGMDLGG